MLRAQTAASALAAGLSVLSNFVAVALNPRQRHESGSSAAAAQAVEAADHEIETAEEPLAHSPSFEVEPETSESSVAAEPAVSVDLSHDEAFTSDQVPANIPVHIEPEVPAVPESPEFDIASLPTNLQELHRRANRVAKVAMQDIKLLRPKDVRLGRENKDICQRLRSDLDKARKEYDRRCHAILDHPVDYFHRWMVEILAEGDSEALGEYPYPSPVLRH